MLKLKEAFPLIMKWKVETQSQYIYNIILKPIFLMYKGSINLQFTTFYKSCVCVLPIYVGYCKKISLEIFVKYLNHIATKTHFVRYL